MIHLGDDVRDLLARALTDGCPVVAASVERDGQPHLSFFGTTQVHEPDQLAIWVRDPNAPFLERVRGNPRVSFLYRNGTERVMYQFHGRARRVDDEEVRALVYERSPEVERSMDPDRGGVAVVIDLDTVFARIGGKPVEMRR